MASSTLSVVIARPVGDVFAYMDDVTREAEWQPNIREAEQIPPGPAAVGSIRRYVSEFMGRRIENRYVIRAYEPGRRVVLETTPDSVLSATTEILWAATPGGTEVSMRVDGKARGALRLIPRGLLERTFEGEVRDALARLKRRLETTA